MLDDYRPPTWKDRLLHPLSIAAIVVAVLGGGLWGYGAWNEAQRVREREAVEPLESEWEGIRSGAAPRLVRVEEVLAKAPEPTEQRCEALATKVEVVHRPVLQGLAAGERNPRPDAPYWLSSSAYRYIAGISTPDFSEPAYRRRNEVVTAALARSCVAVLDTLLAEDARMQDGQRFEGGAVVGWLRVVCLDEPAPRIACQTFVASQPLFAVVVKQSNPRGQAGANAMAASDSAAGEHWKAVAAGLADVGPGLEVVREE